MEALGEVFRSSGVPGEIWFEVVLPFLGTAGMLRLKKGRNACSLNTSTVNALSFGFDDEQTFFSGGYDAAVTRWLASSWN